MESKKSPNIENDKDLIKEEKKEEKDEIHIQRTKKSKNNNR